MISRWLHNITQRQVSIAPLVTFRVLFGAILFISIARFYLNGWIEAQYIQPAFHFKYFGFYWIPELTAAGYYSLFTLTAISAIGIMLGAFYRLSTVLFFLSFTFIELSDATYYLNHYYFVSLVAGLLMFLPAHRQHSLDVRWGLVSPSNTVRALSVNIVKFQLGLVYFLAGVAKLNSDWLLDAMPLALWLPAQSHLPLIGWLMPYEATAYIFSWSGALYDLIIPFILLSARLRWWGYIAVVAFHLMTWSFFQIGMFPFIMIGATLIFFSSDFHRQLHRLCGLQESRSVVNNAKIPRYALLTVAVFAVFQMIFPFRHVIYPGNAFWTEQGYRFGWRVMLMEKAGYAQFKVKDSQGREILVDNSDFLTPVQEKMMSTQPDLMLQYAAHLKRHFIQQGLDASSVSADVYVTFNGRSSQPFIDPNADLAAMEDGWQHKTWILPMEKRDRG